MNFVDVDAYLASDDWHGPNLQVLPQDLLPILTERFLSDLSEEFSKASHGGDFDTSKRAGLALLALYLLLYPRNYPQIGE